MGVRGKEKEGGTNNHGNEIYPIKRGKNRNKCEVWHCGKAAVWPDRAVEVGFQGRVPEKFRCYFVIIIIMIPLLCYWFMSIVWFMWLLLFVVFVWKIVGTVVVIHKLGSKLCSYVHTTVLKYPWGAGAGYVLFPDSWIGSCCSLDTLESLQRISANRQLLSITAQNVWYYY